MGKRSYPQQTAAVLGALLSILSGPAFAQGPGPAISTASPQPWGKYCECTLASREYEAYSNNGACTVQWYNRGRTCEFGFSGMGANPGILDSLRGQDAYKTQLQLAPDIFARYLAFASTGDTAPLSDSKFIEKAIPVLARASLFRAAVVQAELPLKQMDDEIVEFSRKYSEVISSVFRGEKPPHTVPWTQGTQFEIGRGYVLMDFHRQSQLLLLFFSHVQR